MKDIFEQAKTKVKNMTTFEINDTGRDCEYRGTAYVMPFISFLESLNLEPTQKYEHSNNVTIAGVEFAINTDHASFMSKNAYTRDRYERKPQNRYVSLEWISKTVVRVYINKEMDADKIKAQIKRAVEQSAERSKVIDDRQNQDRDNTVAIGKNYSTPMLNKVIETIGIEKGVISFHLKNCSVYFNADGSFIKFSVYIDNVDTIDKMKKKASELSYETNLIPDIVKMLGTMPKLSQELIDWAAKSYHGRFNVKTQNVYKY